MKFSIKPRMNLASASLGTSNTTMPCWIYGSMRIRSFILLFRFRYRPQSNAAFKHSPWRSEDARTPACLNSKLKTQRLFNRGLPGYLAMASPSGWRTRIESEFRNEAALQRFFPSTPPNYPSNPSNLSRRSLGVGGSAVQFSLPLAASERTHHRGSPAFALGRAPPWRARITRIETLFTDH